MKTVYLAHAVCGLLLASLAGHPSWANVLNIGGGLTSLETVPIGNPGNTADTTGYGRVNYDYRIGKYEVTAGQYAEFLNKVAGVDAYGLYNPYMADTVNYLGCNIQRAGGGTVGNPYTYSVAPDWANRPVNYVGYWDSCRFANWLHNGQPSGAQDSSTTEDGAYTLTAGGIGNNTVSRNGNWKWAVASEDEWYKAAYYKGGSTDAGFWLYPTSSNGLPGRDMSEATNLGNNANYWANGYLVGSPYYRTAVGEFELSVGPYGTFDQGGNVAEWNEAVLYASYRGLRGGSFFNSGTDLQASYRMLPPTFEGYAVGFRVIQVPEPVSIVGDINSDGHVDTTDLLYLADSWGKSTGEPGFDPACDLNSNGNVNIVDLLVLAENWGA